MGFELYEVKVTADAEEDLSTAVQYLLFEKKNVRLRTFIYPDFSISERNKYEFPKLVWILGT